MSKTTKEALAALGANLEAPVLSIEEAPEPEVLSKRPRIRIQLEDNVNIPPGGQFFQVGGSNPDGTRFLHSYLLKPSVPANVPEDLVEILNNAMGSVPVLDDQQSVIGYRDVLRFPYRVLQAASSVRA